MRKHGAVIYLTAPVAVLQERLIGQTSFPPGGGGEANRPSLTGGNCAAEFYAVMQQREPLYQAAAHYSIDATALPDNIVEAILLFCKISFIKVCCTMQ